MLGLTRASLVPLLVLGIANGVFLYFFPSRAEPDYAWAIAPPASAAAMGAGYLAGTLVTAGVGLFAVRRFGSLRGLVPAFSALAIVLLAATLIHADRFRWDHAATWLWTAVYAALAPATILLALRQSRLAPETSVTPDERLGRVRAPSLALGSILAAVALALFSAPDWLLERWPWPITPLIARVLAGWYLLAALTLLYVSVTARRANELPLTYGVVACWSLLTLPIPLIYSESMRTGAALYWPFIALHAAVLVFCALVCLRSLQWMRATGEHL
jgi:hypothetical protein